MKKEEEEEELQGPATELAEFIISQECPRWVSSVIPGIVPASCSFRMA